MTAFCLAAEAGSFSRFRSAPAYAAWVGLVPSEHSSGEKVARGGITKTGNAASRRALVEAAWHFASCLPSPKAPAKAGPGSEGVPADVERRCAKCTARLAARHRALREAGKRPCMANVAVARELACWVGVGGGLPGGGHAPLTSRPHAFAPRQPFQPGGPAPRRVAGARPRFLYGQPEGRARQERLDGFWTGAPDGESKCGGRGDISRVSRAAPKARGY